MDPLRLDELVRKQYEGSLSQEERGELLTFLGDQQNEVSVKALIERVYTIAGDERKMNEESAQQILRLILGAEVIALPKRSNWYRIAAAAIIIVGLTTAGLLYFNKKEPVAVSTVANKDVKAPSQNHAAIKLSDGKMIYLDSAGNGQLADDNNVKLVKPEDGKLAYQASTDETIKEVKYNTLSNPRGSKVIDMTLADGSRVWLNAGSSITYPIAFIEEKREVKLDGEAYFEVAHDANKPFHVSVNSMDIEVLGTHFNVNAYNDEENIKTTLLEGSVKVSAANKSVTIKPGEQAQINAGNAIGFSVSKNVNIDQVMAWKNGIFNFDNVDLQTIMRQISRWYNVDVEYQSNVPIKTFKGEISMNVPASKVLEILAYAGVHFKIEDNKIIVMP